MSDPGAQWQKLRGSMYRHVRHRHILACWDDDETGAGYAWHLLNTNRYAPWANANPAGDWKVAFRRFNRALQGYDPLALRLTNPTCLAWRIWLREDRLPPLQ